MQFMSLIVLFMIGIGICSYENQCKEEERIHEVYNRSSKSDVRICARRQFVNAGQRLALDDYSGNLDTIDCSPETYQPEPYLSGGKNGCKEKSKCNETGQLVANDGTTTTDRACYCDYEKCYNYSQSPNNKGQCFPNTENCECEIAMCGPEQVFSKAYKCVSVKRFNSGMAELGKQGTECRGKVPTEGKVPKESMAIRYGYLIFLSILVVIGLSFAVAFVKRKKKKNKFLKTSSQNKEEKDISTVTVSQTPLANTGTDHNHEIVNVPVHRETNLQEDLTQSATNHGQNIVIVHVSKSQETNSHTDLTQNVTSQGINEVINAGQQRQEEVDTSGEFSYSGPQEEEKVNTSAEVQGTGCHDEDKIDTIAANTADEQEPQTDAMQNKGNCVQEPSTKDEKTSDGQKSVIYTPKYYNNEHDSEPSGVIDIQKGKCINEKVFAPAYEQQEKQTPDIDGDVDEEVALLKYINIHKNSAQNTELGTDEEKKTLLQSSNNN